MNPRKVERSRVKLLTDLPNIGPSLADSLRLLGIHEPGQLVGRSPYEMYDRLCEKTACRQDPCVLDVFISVTRFMDGGDPQPWWSFTAERKQSLGQHVPASTI